MHGATIKIGDLFVYKHLRISSRAHTSSISIGPGVLSWM